MRWPFVDVLTFDELRLERDAERLARSLADSRAEKWEARYDAILGKYEALFADMLAMRRDGFVSTPKPLPVPAVKASPSDEAITMRAGTDGRLRQHLTNWRNVARQNGAKDEELAERILRWDDPDGRDD
jgi:hypothetical protein